MELNSLKQLIYMLKENMDPTQQESLEFFPQRKTSSDKPVLNGPQSSESVLNSSSSEALTGQTIYMHQVCQKKKLLFFQFY